MSGASILILLEVVLLIGLSAICSGLNVAVMSLDMADLKRKAKLGDKRAKRVLPLRTRTHLTLASILLTNVAVVSASSLVLTQRFDGWVAGLLSTLLIVVFGEILPQAIFTRDALGWSARFATFLKGLMIVTYVISRPLQILLDWLFPHRQQRVQSRDELGLLISEHLENESSELDEDEVGIMRGALQLSEKRVKSIATPIRNTYWLTLDTLLDDAKIDELKGKGFSRIPVFNKELDHCYGIMLMKELVDIDFDEQAVYVHQMRLHTVRPIGGMTALDTALRKFIVQGTHLLPVEKDDKIIGIVTIEDLFEEIVGQEIEDETDRGRQKRLA